MALSMSTTFRGIQVADAYWKVASISGNKSLLEIVVTASASRGQVAFDSRSMTFAYNLDGANPIAQAYAHLKSLPEFAGATDC